MNLKAIRGGEAAEATIEKLSRPDAWDVVGLIQDVEKRLEDSGDGEAGAVVGWLLSRYNDFLNLEDEISETRSGIKQVVKNLQHAPGTEEIVEELQELLPRKDR